MPFIITTTTPDRMIPAHEIRGSDIDRRAFAVERRAVATLDEARDAVRDALPLANLSQVYRIDDMPESGGSFNAPDGTVIEVERVSWFELRNRTGAEPGDHLRSTAVETRAAVLESFNA